MRSLAFALLAATLLASPAHKLAAQPIATSPRPDAVSVTVYRAPGRSARERMELRWLNGFALISERRQVSIPAGDATIRFEGVAGGIVPESAIVTGLPEGVVEKNQDADLLSPASLVDRSLGRRVHIRRTSAETGEVSEQEAVIRSGANGAVVLQTAQGVEALRCSGLEETIVYPSIPEGLSPKPTLSVRTRSERPATATLTLSYLATGFDWQANYVAHLSPDGERMDLFAWLTLANGDETSFVGASTQAVAGRLNREDDQRRDPPRGQPLQLRCWPEGSTSDIPLQAPGAGPTPPPPPPPPPAPISLMSLESADSIVVTGSRIARREELGDLKLYRVPEPVTVAANSQKQVALLEQPRVKVATVYRQRVMGGHGEGESYGARRFLVTRNRAAEGLGLPLPAGPVAVFATGRERPIFLGEGSIEDLAVDEDVEMFVGEAFGVRTAMLKLPPGQRDRMTHGLTVTNAHPYPVRFEAEIVEDSGEKLVTRTRLGRRDGHWLWAVTVPANGSAMLRHRVERPDPPND